MAKAIKRNGSGLRRRTGSGARRCRAASHAGSSARLTALVTASCLAFAGIQASVQFVGAGPSAAVGPANGQIAATAGDTGNGLGTQVAQQPYGLAVASDGGVYVSDFSDAAAFSPGAGNADGDSVIRRIDPSTGNEQTVAGDGVSNLGVHINTSVDALHSALYDPAGMSIDPTNGSLVFDEPWLGVVARYTPPSGPGAGSLAQVTSDQTGGFGDGGDAAMDSFGDVVYPEFSGSDVKVYANHTGTLWGVSLTAGSVTPINTPHDDPWAVAIDQNNNLIVSDASDSIDVLPATTGSFYGQSMTAGTFTRIAGNGACCTSGYGGDNGPAISALVGSPHGLSVDSHGNLLIADTFNNRVRVIAGSTGVFYGISMTYGDIYTVAGSGGLGSFGGDGGAATSALLKGPTAAVADKAGNLVIADVGNLRVRVVAESTSSFYGQSMQAGDIYTVAGNGWMSYSGDGGPETAAQLGIPEDVSFDASGNELIADSGNGRIRVVPAASGPAYGQTMTAGDIYTVAGGGAGGDGGAATSATLSSPGSVRSDASGNLLIADTQDNRIRVVAETTGTSYGQPMSAGDIYTIAGTGTSGFAGDSGAGTSAELNAPQTAILDSSGNVVIADSGNNRVRVLAEHTGNFYGQAMMQGDIYTIAGTATGGFNGDKSPATTAELNRPIGLALDSQGNVLVADNSNDRVRVLFAQTGTDFGSTQSAGAIVTIMGGGATFTQGVAPLSLGLTPNRLTVDKRGDVIVSDNELESVYVLPATSGTYWGQTMTAGTAYYVAGHNTGCSTYTASGAATSAYLCQPGGVAVDPSGDITVASPEINRVFTIGNVLSITPTSLPGGSVGQVYGPTTLNAAGGATPFTWGLTTGALPPGLNLGSDGTITGTPTTSGTFDFTVQAASSDDPPQSVTEPLSITVQSLTINPTTPAEGFVNVAYSSPALTASNGYTPFSWSVISGTPPPGVQLNADGTWTGTPTTQGTYSFTVQVIDSDPGGAQTATAPLSIIVEPYATSIINTVAGTGASTNGTSTSGSSPAATDVGQPAGVTTDAFGNTIIADDLNGEVDVIAAQTGTFYGVNMTQGEIYLVAGGGTGSLTGTGNLATGFGLTNPDGLAIDGAGNLVVADFGNDQVYVVANTTGTDFGQTMSAGDIYLLAGGGFGFSGAGGPATSAAMGEPTGVAVDHSGNVLISDFYDNTIWEVADSTTPMYGIASPIVGDIYTIADSSGASGDSGDGAAATAATLQNPGDVAVDSAGNVVIADTLNNAVRVIAESTTPMYGIASPLVGDIYTIAGNGSAAFAGDGGPATSSQLSDPFAVTFDSLGDLYVADQGNNRIRMIPSSDGTFYGLSMVANDIYTVAGDGTSGFSGDGHASGLAELGAPGGVAVTPDGTLAIADTLNNRVRDVAGGLPTAGTPSTPSGLMATPGNGQVVLNWNTASGATGYSVYDATTTGGEVTTGPAACTAVAPATTCTVSPLTNGTEYFFVVVATNGTNVSAPSGETNATPEAAPGNFTLTPTAENGQVQLGWTSSSNASSYTVYYAPSPGDPLSGSSTCTATTSLMCTVGGLTNGTTYDFEVVATGVGGSTDSNEASATPEAAPGPFTLGVMAGDAQVALSWSPSTDASSYTVWYAASPGDPLIGSSTCVATTALVCTVNGLTDGVNYNFEVVATGAGGSTDSNELNATPEIQPGAFSLTSATPSTGQVVVDWGASTNAANGYTVYYSTSSGGELAGSTACANTTLTTCTVSGLTNGTKYYFEVEAFDGTVTTLSSNELNATPEIQPGAFSLTSATPSTGQVVVDWGASTNAANGYTVYYSTSSGGELAGSTACANTTLTTCTVSGLTNGTKYYFEVEAFDGTVTTLSSNELNATPEIQPGAFSLTSATPSTGQVVVDWGASTNAANGYTVYYSTSSGGELAGSTACANTTLTTCTVSGLTNGTKYYFEVEAFDGTVTTLSSNELNATPEIQPGAFSLTSATPSTGQVVVDWGASTNAANGYTVYYSTSSGGELAGSTACANTTLTTCTVSGLTNGTKYYFEVEAFDGTVTTLSSNELNATPEIQPGAFSLTSATPSTGQVVVDWGASTNAANGYTVYYSTSSGGELAGSTACANTTLTTCTVSGLTNGTKYYFEVEAFDGTVTTLSSNELNATPEIQPGAFSLTSATPSTGQVVVDWGASTNAANGYTVYYSTSSGGELAGSTACANTTLTTCTVSGLTNGTKYYFEVEAFDGTVTTLSSNELNATPEIQPGAFSLTSATPSTGQVVVDWGASTNAANGYTVYYSTSSGGELAGSTACANTTLTTCTVSGLTNGTKYYFEVEAFDGTVTTLSSNELNATPEIQPGAFSLTSATPSTGQVVVDWGASTNAANGYTVYYSTSSGGELAGSTACANTTLTTCTVSGLTNGTKYYFEVEAFDGTVTTLSSNELNATPEIQPGAFSLTSATPSTGQVVVDWGASTNAANGYTVYYSTSSGGELAGSTACANTTLTTCTVSGLTNGTKYYFEVEAFDGTVTTLSSNELNATPEIQPGAFSLTSATPSTGQVVVDWGASTNAANGYTVYYSTSSGGELAGSTACANTTLTTCTVSGLTNGTKYYFEVEAFDGTVTTLSSNELNATPEIQPGAFSLTSATPSTGQVVVDWGASTNAANGYTVYYSTSSGGELAGSTACANTTLTTCTVSGLTNGTKYYFEVEAFDGTVTTLSSNELNATPEIQPGAFSLTSATPSTGQVVVDWGASTNAANGYTVYYSTSSGGELAGSTACANTTLTTCTVSGLTNGTKYYFEVEAFDGTVTTLSSNELNATPTGTSSSPTITKVQPASGSDSGGTSVTITGSGFSTTSGATTIKFGSTAASGVKCSSTTSCTATSPSGMGTVDVTVTVAGHTSATNPADQFTYLIADCARVKITQTTFVTWGHILCLGPGSVVYAPIFVLRGAGLLSDGTDFAAPVSAVNSVAYQVCGSQIAEEMDVSGADALVTIGGPSGSSCAGNTVTDEVTLTQNTDAVEFDYNTVADVVTILGTTGALPPPYSGSVQAIGNNVVRGGKLIIKP